MAKVKKFAMGGMDLNRSSRRPPPAPVRPPPQAGQPAAIANLQRAISGTPVGLAGMGAAMRSGSGLTPMPVARQSQQSPMSSGSMMGAFNQPIARASGQPVQVPNTSGTPA